MQRLTELIKYFDEHDIPHTIALTHRIVTSETYQITIVSAFPTKGFQRAIVREYNGKCWGTKSLKVLCHFVEEGIRPIKPHITFNCAFSFYATQCIEYLGELQRRAPGAFHVLVDILERFRKAKIAFETWRHDSGCFCEEKAMQFHNFDAAWVVEEYYKAQDAIASDGTSKEEGHG